MLKYDARRAAGLCVKCGQPVDREGIRCAACAEKFAEYQRGRRAYYAGLGRCSKCGKQRDDPQWRMCAECRGKGAGWYMPVKAEGWSTDSKPVESVTTGERFRSIYAAAKARGYGRTYILKSIRTGFMTHGEVWRLVNEPKR